MCGRRSALGINLTRVFENISHTKAKFIGSADVSPAFKKQQAGRLRYQYLYFLPYGEISLNRLIMGGICSMM